MLVVTGRLRQGFTQAWRLWEGKKSFKLHKFSSFMSQGVRKARKNATECCFPGTELDFYFVDVTVQQNRSKFEVVQLDKSILLR